MRILFFSIFLFLPSFSNADSSGEEFLPTQGQNIAEPGRKPEQELFAVRVNDKWGFANASGTLVVEAIYDMAFPFQDGLAKVLKNKKWGFIGANGRIEVKNEFDDAKSYSEGLAPVKKGLKWGYVDRSGNMIIQPELEDAFNFSSGTALVLFTTESPKGLALSSIVASMWIDRNGRMVYKSNGVNYSGVEVIVSSIGKYGLSSFWKILLEPRYEDIKLPGSVALFLFKENGKYGYLDTTGKVSIQPSFEDAETFSHSLAKVKTAGKYGLINSSGIFTVAAEYDSLSWVSNNKLSASRGEETGDLDLSTGKFTAKPVLAEAQIKSAPTHDHAQIEEYLSVSSGEINVVMESFADTHICDDLIKEGIYKDYRPLVYACGIDLLEEKGLKENCYICYLALAEYYARKEGEPFDEDKSARNADKAILINPSDPRPYKLRAAMLLKYEDEGYFEDFKQAINDYLKLVELEPNNISYKSDACRAGAKSTRLLGLETAAAIRKLCDEAVKADPNNSANLIARAAILSAAGDNTASISDLDAVLKIDKNNPRILLAKAREYEALKDWRRAAFYYSRAMESNADNIDPEILGSRGRCYLHLASCEKAKSDLEAAGKKLSGVDSLHYMASYYWTCEKNLLKTLEYIEYLHEWGQCEGSCYRPEDYRDFLSGLDENPEYKTLLEKYKDKSYKRD